MQIPKFLVDDFTYQGRVPVDFQLIDEMNGGNVGRQVWSQDYIDSMVRQLAGGNYNVRMYSEQDVKNMDRHLREETISGGVKGKRALVIGTQVN